MLKTAALNARCLSTSLQKASHIHSSSRLLHNSNDISSPPRNDDAVFSPTKKKPGTRHTPRQPEQSSSAIRDDAKGEAVISWNDIITPPVKVLQKFPMTAREKRSLGKISAKGQPRFNNKLGRERAIRPAVQAARVNELGEKGQLEEAIAYMYDAPRDTLNIITWNTLLTVLMKAGKRKRAYEVYSEMKRRGFVPNSGTYVTMLMGMSCITSEEWPSNQDNLMRTHKIYESFETHIALCEERGISSELLSASSAHVCYIRAITKAGLFQRAIDLFYSAPETGPMARDKFVYTIMFQGLKFRTTTDKLGNLSPQEQNASDAKFLWRTLEKDVERGMEVDPHVIFSFLKLMVDGRPADQLFGLEVVHDYCGLAAPGETAPPARVPLNSHILHATLELCNKVQKHRLCSYFMKQILDQQRVGVSQSGNLTIHPAHIHEFIFALRRLATEGSFDESTRAVEAIRFLMRSTALENAKSANTGPKSQGDKRLRAYTVAHAFAICWRCKDWESAMKLFSLAARCSADDYLDDGPASRDKREPKSFPLVNIASYAHMARTALLTETKGNMRQCLRMISIRHIKNDPYETYSKFYLVTLSKAIIKLVGAASEGASEWDRRRFQELVTRSREVLSTPVHIEKPELEETLGSAKYIDKLEQAIGFELSARKSS